MKEILRDKIWSEQFSKEPVDLRLLFILCLRRIWIPVLMGIIAGVVMGAIHFTLDAVKNKDTAYRAEYKFYTDYYKDEDGVPIRYINHETWDELVKTDFFTEKITDELKNAKVPFSFAIDKESLRKYLSARLYSDWYLVSAYAYAPSPEEALRLGEAFSHVFPLLDEEDFGIKSVTVMTIADKAERIRDIEGTFRAFVLGFLMAGIFSLVAIILRYVWEERIRLPKTFETRYKIPMIGAFWGETHSKDAEANAQYLLKDCEKIALVATDSHITLSRATTSLESILDLEIKAFGCLYETPEAIEEIRDYKEVVLIISPKSRLAMIEFALSMLSRHDCNIRAAMLIDAEDKLLQFYYLGKNKG